MIPLRHEPSMGTLSVHYESDTASDERPVSQPARTKIQAHFQIARPAPKTSASFRLVPKLLLQIQQLSQNQRPVPVLEIWQPALRKSKLTREFPRRPKLRAGDIYATRDEPFMSSASCARKGSSMVESRRGSEGNIANKEIVAAICQSTDNGSKTSMIHFRNAQCSWQADVGTTGPDKKLCYRFTISDDNNGGSDPGRMIMQWEKRGLAGKGDGSLQPVESDQFVLVLIDRVARRKSRIATMTPGGLEVMVRKTSIMEHLQICLDLTCPISTTESRTLDAHENLELWLYTQVLTMGVWVAQQEGWLGG